MATVYANAYYFRHVLIIPDVSLVWAMTTKVMLDDGTYCARRMPVEQRGHDVLSSTT